MKPTMKRLNNLISKIEPELELVKGEGYFYFGLRDDVIAGPSTTPKSIFVPHLCHASIEWWEDTIKASLEEWAAEEYADYLPGDPARIKNKSVKSKIKLCI